MAKGINDDGFNELFPFVILWSIITVTYPELAILIKLDPRTLFRVSILVKYYDLYSNLVTGKKPIEDIDLDRMYGQESPNSLRISNEINMGFSRLRGLDVEALRLVVIDPNLFELLKLISRYYSMPAYTSSSDSELDQNYLHHAELLKQVIDIQD